MANTNVFQVLIVYTPLTPTFWTPQNGGLDRCFSFSFWHSFQVPALRFRGCKSHPPFFLLLEISITKNSIKIYTLWSQQFAPLKPKTGYCWRKKACTSRDVVYPIIYRAYIHPRWLAGFLPSTVWPNFWNARLKISVVSGSINSLCWGWSSHLLIGNPYNGAL